MVSMVAGTNTGANISINICMEGWHIHMSGIVQGVGFRPLVYRIATTLQLKGYVCNAGDGLHVYVDAAETEANHLYQLLLTSPPQHALITSRKIEKTNVQGFKDFSIRLSDIGTTTDLLLTPDIAMCDDCRREITNIDDHRHHYSFTTCLRCGPRYSIIHQMPYDRENTTMADLKMCARCNSEYHNVEHRRHFSQTNSCPDCAIDLHLYDGNCNEMIAAQADLPLIVASLLSNGAVIAVKGVGGYLLLCDATSEATVRRLRQRKHRPMKPLAVMFENLSAAGASVDIRNFEAKALQSPAAPIVLCRWKENPDENICRLQVAPGLDKLGVMLPYSPLLYLISTAAGRPLVATSANFSGSPIMYKDDDALSLLGEVADYVLTYDREIIIPQDDSVVQFTDEGRQIILRRSRGLAPNYYPNPFHSKASILATGADLKSSFAIQSAQNLFISQFLGDQSALESQESYEACFHHLAQALNFQPSIILADAHPGYYSTAFAAMLANDRRIPLQQVQHHRAHFAAVLAENNLLEKTSPVLGFTWDGTGYGDDHQIWGGETFTWIDGSMERSFHLDPFVQLSGDKMSKEPRLSALSLLHHAHLPAETIHQHFSDTEWNYFQKQLQHPGVYTSSMGRLIDGVAALLGICRHNRYEGHAAMFLEVAARKDTTDTTAYRFRISNGTIYWQPVIRQVLADRQSGIAETIIAGRFLRSLAGLVEEVSAIAGIDALAFGGGVFQNATLVQLITERLRNKKQLYFHQQLSPNDECIAFGQLAWYHAQQLHAFNNNHQEINSKLCV